jgi:hypothetical protein
MLEAIMTNLGNAVVQVAALAKTGVEQMWDVLKSNR